MTSSSLIFRDTAANATCHDTTVEMQSIVFPATPPKISFFTTHQLKPKGMYPVSYIHYQQDWILILFLLCFLLLAWIQVFNAKRFRQILQAPFSKRFHNQMIRDGNLFNERISIALGIIYFITAGLMIYQADMLLPDHFPKNIEGIYLYLLIIFCLLIFWLLKISIIRILETIFKTYHASSDYMLNILLMNVLSGLLLLPLLILVIYLKSGFLLYICLILFSILFVFRLVRGFTIGMSYSKFSYLLLFVYLCTLEILPLIILAKLTLTYYHSTIHVY
ncbi:MAG: DUF4271 domain-containing protein [Bacteroidetes bacterium]|nr:DUF4271 domain-containing protein [Bacteroidota bacterium]